MMKLNVHYNTVNVPMKDIYHDSFFNSRGFVAPLDVIELSQSIEKDGLLEPIMLQEFTEKKGFKYRILAGHRRHIACKILKWDQIPARIIPLNEELDANRINFIENLHRTNLNILQEARALDPYRKKGYSAALLAEEFSQPVSWVNIRFQLLDLPPEIQEVAAAGLLNQRQIREIASLKNRDDQIEVVKEIKRQKDKGERVITRKKITQEMVNESRIPTTAEINEMLMFLSDTTGPGIHTRLLAWTAGNISLAQAMKDVEQYCRDKGKSFNLPVHLQEVMVA